MKQHVLFRKNQQNSLFSNIAIIVITFVIIIVVLFIVIIIGMHLVVITVLLLKRFNKNTTLEGQYMIVHIASEARFRTRFDTFLIR